MAGKPKPKNHFCGLIEDMLGMHLPSLDKMSYDDIEALYHLLSAKLEKAV